jgi:hypothetical protein
MTDVCTLLILDVISTKRGCERREILFDLGLIIMRFLNRKNSFRNDTRLHIKNPRCHFDKARIRAPRNLM